MQTTDYHMPIDSALAVLFQGASLWWLAPAPNQALPNISNLDYYKAENAKYSKNEHFVHAQMILWLLWNIV